MAETDEREGAGAAGEVAAGRESAATGAEGAGARGDEDSKLSAEEESAKAMEAEVPHPPGYADGGQEPPADAGEGQRSDTGPELTPKPGPGQPAGSGGGRSS